jgi:putative nucleotidyltransferase with HDIG domain
VTQTEESRLERLMPEIREISSLDLRRKVMDVWARALAESSFNDLTEVPGESWVDPKITQLHHQRAVAKMAISVADAFEQVVPDVKLDRDLLVAGALLHDVGKAFEYDPARSAIWRKQPQAAGYPSIRHPIYGVHLGLAAKLPEPLLHIIAAHASEGALVRRSLENTLIAAVDMLFWDLVAKARTGLTFGELEKQAIASENSRISSKQKAGRKRKAGSRMRRVQ